MNNYQSEKKLILKYYSELDSAVGDDHYKIMDKYIAKNYLWRGFHPFNEKHSTQELVSDFWIPFKKAITRTQRRMDIFMAGGNLFEAGGGLCLVFGVVFFGLLPFFPLRCLSTKKQPLSLSLRY